MSLEKNDPIQIIRFKQKRREIIIAHNILTLLDNKDLNAEIINEKIKNINTNAFSDMIVNLIGYLYIEIAQNYLNNFKFILNSFNEFKRKIENKYKFSISLIKIMKNNSKKENDKQKENTNTNNFIDIMLSLICIDIENTIKKICFKILNDFGVSKDIKEQRATNLLYIGSIFYKENYDENRSKEFIIEQIGN